MRTFSGLVSPKAMLNECARPKTVPTFQMTFKSSFTFSLVFVFKTCFTTLLKLSPSTYSMTIKRSLGLTCSNLGTAKPLDSRRRFMAHSLSSLDMPATANVLVPTNHNVSGNHLKFDQFLNRLTITFLGPFFVNNSTV